MAGGTGRTPPPTPSWRCQSHGEILGELRMVHGLLTRGNEDQQQLAQSVNRLLIQVTEGRTRSEITEKMRVDSEAAIEKLIREVSASLHKSIRDQVGDLPQRVLNLENRISHHSGESDEVKRAKDRLPKWTSAMVSVVALLLTAALAVLTLASR